MADGGRYLQLLAETMLGLVAGAWESAEAIAHHERLHDEVRRHGENTTIDELVTYTLDSLT